jgi:hypothetical protein
MSKGKERGQVIDEQLLVEGIKVNLDPKENDAAKGGNDVNLIEVVSKVEKLTISFKKIAYIENLNGFSNLVKLCLDNNLIENIVNISHLKSLRWLDLSFNRIRKIQGLEELKQLEDLTLYSNKITYLDGLDHLSNLQCLSLGNNRIDSLDQVMKLRSLRNLKMLTLAENPVCKENEYKMVVLAYIDTLKYLDYVLIDVNEYRVAKEQYHDEILDIEEKESVVKEKSSRDKQLEQHLDVLSQAAILFAHTVIEELTTDEADLDRLKHLPGIKELIEQFRSGYKAMSEEYIQTALARYDVKKKEIDDFEVSITNLRTRAEDESTALIIGYNDSRKVVAALLTSPSASYSIAERTQMVKKLHEELDKICDELMTIELRLIEKFDVLVDEFDNKLMEMKNFALEGQQVFFRAVEELEDKFSGGIRLVVQDLVERLANEELAEDYLDDEAMSLIVDKDSCMGLVNASHDAHVGKIMKREDDARNLETKRYQDMIAGHISAERARNRDRVLQIHQFCQSSKGLSNALLIVDEDDAYDEEK